MLTACTKPPTKKKGTISLQIKKLLLKLYYTSVTFQCAIRSTDCFVLNNVENYENINLSQTAPTAMRYDSTILPKHTLERNNI
jgi:hypothetical protein